MLPAAQIIHVVPTMSSKMGPTSPHGPPPPSSSPHLKQTCACASHAGYGHRVLAGDWLPTNLHGAERWLIDPCLRGLVLQHASDDSPLA